MFYVVIDTKHLSVLYISYIMNSKTEYFGAQEVAIFFFE